MMSLASIYSIDYHLKLFGPTKKLCFGYLFLCPLAEVQAEGITNFRLPDHPAYWSLDLSGAKRLGDEVAEDLGFPAIQLQMRVGSKSWDTSVYDGIRQFHEAKGFDPYSQEVALELGAPLIQVSCGQGTLLAHLQQSDHDDYYSDSDGDSYDSESADEQYDSASSELGEAFPIQEEDIDCEAPEKTRF
ncbi:hypothetical protein C8R45DRAFT_562324 [Mycena sanguinolenta]|nr:hypothetical protein C8R45DRAFT_562324 [Mycena sanguinolenta]